MSRIKQIVDGTVEAVEETINDYFSPPPPSAEPADCVNDVGAFNGALDGRSSFSSPLPGAFDPSAHSLDGYHDAYAACYEPVAAANAPFDIPSFDHPVLTALEVTLTPSETNLPEVSYFLERGRQEAAESVYQDAYQSGYVNAGIEAFDAKIEERFQPRYDEPPQAAVPVPTDTPAAALDYNPVADSFGSGPNWSSGSDIGGTYGGADSGSSSDGRSSSSRD